MQAKSSQIHNHHNQNSNKWSKLTQQIDYGRWQRVKWSQESEAQPRECKRDCNIFQVFWFDILDENGLPFIEKTAHRLTPESMFMV